MPIFYDVDLDDGDFEIDAEDFYSACDKNEIDNLIDYLEFDGYVERIGFGQSPTMADNDWKNVLDNLKVNRLRISSEDEEIIKQISKKY